MIKEHVTISINAAPYLEKDLTFAYRSELCSLQVVCEVVEGRLSKFAI